MKRIRAQVEHPRFLMGAKSATRIGVIFLFALIFACVLGTAGQGLLDLFYERIRGLNQPTDTTLPDRLPASYTSIVGLCILGALFGGYVGSKVVRALEGLGNRWDKMEVGDKVTLFVGLFAGLIASIPLMTIVQYLPVLPLYRLLLIFGLTLGLSALSIYALQSMADVLPWNRVRGKSRRSGIKILDTNVIIDGRIYDVAKTGFLEGQLYVPRFVLEELQYIADSHDSLRRQRGRRGLEVLKHMQAEFNLDVGTHDKLAPDPNEEVDARLVRLAKSLGADIVTNDFNLNRVAALQDLKVLSLNDLSLALRTNVLPQETMSLKIIREGNQLGQGVGYLEDGTMVVVEHGQPRIGETVEVIVTQVIQTERGKMIFADIEAPDEAQFEPPRRRTPRRNHV